MNKFKFSGVFAALIFGVYLLSGCAPAKDYSKEYSYFQDADSLQKVMVNLTEYQIRKDDVLGIGISSASMNTEQLMPFMSVAKTEKGDQVGTLPDYMVDADGLINLPLIGKVKVEGLTQKQAQQELESKLGDYIGKPNVSVIVKNFSVTILGEVKIPGPHIMPTTKPTLLDAIGAAGDLTVFGDRQDILLMRRNARGEVEFNRLDLTKASSFMDPRFFQLSQNDVIYVPTSKTKIKESTTDQSKYQKYYLAFAAISTISILFQIIYLVSSN